MSVENKQKRRNLSIPEKAIEGAAGIHDKFEINGFWTKSICDKEIDKPTKSNTKTLTENPKRREVKYSIDLEEGMTIPANDGGIETVRAKKQEDMDR